MVPCFQPEQHECGNIFQDTTFIIIFKRYALFGSQNELLVIDSFKVDLVFIQIDSLQIVSLLIFIVALLACWILYADADLSFAW